MTRAQPTRITIGLDLADEYNTLIDPKRLAWVTFYGSSLPDEGSRTTLPREDIINYVTKWLKP